MSFFNDLKAKLTSVVSSFITQVKALAGYFLPKLADLAEVAIEDILQIATAAVLAEAPKLISGQEKFDSAVSAVLNTVKSQGKTIAINTAGAAVQLAYLEIQNVVKGK